MTRDAAAVPTGRPARPSLSKRQRGLVEVVARVSTPTMRRFLLGWSMQAATTQRIQAALAALEFFPTPAA